MKTNKLAQVIDELHQKMDRSRELEFDSWVEQFIGQALLTSRLNSGLLGALPLGT
jgi:hypothetical protein